MARARARKKKGRGGKRGNTPLLSRIGAALSLFVSGDEVDEETSNHLQEIKGLLLIGAALWLGVALASYHTPYGLAGKNWGGQAGWYLASWVYVGLGWSGYLLVFLALTWGGVLVARKHVGWPMLRVFGGLCFLLSAAFLAELALGESRPPSAALPYGPGGYLALTLVGGEVGGAAPLLIEKLGGPGLWILLVLAAVISFMLATEMAFFPAALAFAEWVAERRERRGESLPAAITGWLVRLFRGLWSFLRGSDLEAATVPGGARAGGAKKPKPRRRAKSADETGALFAEDDEEEDEDEEEWDEEEEPEEEDEYEEYDEDEDEDEDEEEEEEEDDEEEEEEEEEVTPQPRKRPAREAVGETIVFDPPTPPPGPWTFPPLDLLVPPQATRPEDEQLIEAQAQSLENALGSFRVQASVVRAKVGATVTLFELEVAQGTRMNKVTTAELKRSPPRCAPSSVRIIAPIPGKADRSVSRCRTRSGASCASRELITQKRLRQEIHGPAALPRHGRRGLACGGGPGAHAAPPDRRHHRLGQVGVHQHDPRQPAADALAARHPDDPGRPQDGRAADLREGAAPDAARGLGPMRQATNVLLWAVEKMEGRYELFKRTPACAEHQDLQRPRRGRAARAPRRDHWNEERTPRHVPYIVVVIDEMADLMMTSKKEAEHGDHAPGPEVARGRHPRHRRHPAPLDRRHHRRAQGQFADTHRVPGGEQGGQSRDPGRDGGGEASGAG